ncbi:hypothetical protein Naga_100054g26 [Nannochloropsis gaditana]|uniref:Uncharacterized protein n=1 Tax=Nannochloropsis gaditana TaxID=72520 RepID=W7TQQ5_9STRA|nr:hypothetical protein Naga_100054g26 [Nannochloropsis gaditana]
MDTQRIDTASDHAQKTLSGGDGAASAKQPSVVRHDGPLVCIDRGQSALPEQGYDFLMETLGCDLGSELLGSSKEEYGARWLREVRLRFQERRYEKTWETFLENGGKCGGRCTYWAILQVPSDRSFDLHVHPCFEVLHVLRGRLYERRMLGPPLSLAEEEGKPVREMAPVDLSGLCPPPDFRDGVFQEDTINVNEMGSVHQSWTGEEGCIILLLWAGGHCFIDGACLPQGYEKGGCCTESVKD